MLVLWTTGVEEEVWARRARAPQSAFFSTTMSSEDVVLEDATHEQPQTRDAITTSKPYYEDGNIVLVSCAPRTSFKVHRGVLAKRSTIFGDMFGIPQPPGDGEKLDGCAVVHLSETALELERFLTAIYEALS